MHYERFQIYLAALKQVRDQPVEPSGPVTGVCIQFDRRLEKLPPCEGAVEDALDDLSALIDDWPEHSGFKHYPVPHPEVNAIQAYLEADEEGTEEAFWGDHEYGRARRRLLDWLIARVETTILLLAALKELQEIVTTEGRSGLIHTGDGICDNALALMQGDPGSASRWPIARDVLEDLMKEWPEYSGHSTYPVPHPTKGPKEAYHHEDKATFWSPDSEYGSARLRLLGWLIDTLSGTESMA